MAIKCKTVILEITSGSSTKVIMLPRVQYGNSPPVAPVIKRMLKVNKMPIFKLLKEYHCIPSVTPNHPINVLKT